MPPERIGWSPEIALQVAQLRRGIFFEQETRAFAEGRCRFVEGLAGGKYRRRGTGCEYGSLEEALGAVADSLVGPLPLPEHGGLPLASESTGEGLPKVSF